MSVADAGIGVAEAERPQLFTLFFRGDVPLVREQVGAGMNLYMLRRFVETMGGAYGAEFPAGGGSRFWVRLPVAG
jgi:signal transduction histidine kinase